MDDVDDIYDAAIESRVHVFKWMDWLTKDYSRETTEDWFKLSLAAWESGEAYEHVVIDKDTKAIVGALQSRLLGTQKPSRPRSRKRSRATDLRLRLLGDRIGSPGNRRRGNQSR